MASYYELLGIATSATTAEVRQAYARLAREKHPDRFPDPKVKAGAQLEFQEITAAFNTLANEARRKEYDESLKGPARAPVPQEIAADAYERGVRHYEAKSYFEAVELFRIAVAHMPGDPRYHAGLGRALARNPHWVREGLQSMEKAVQLAPRHAPFHAELAELLLRQGLKLRARRAAEAALRIDARQAAAQKVLDEIGPGDDGPPSAEGGLKGLLRRKP